LCVYEAVCCRWGDPGSCSYRSAFTYGGQVEDICRELDKEGPFNSITDCQNECPNCGDGTVQSAYEDCDNGKHCADGTSCTTDTDCTDSSSCIPRDGDGCSLTCRNEAICCRPGDPDSCQYHWAPTLGRTGNEICQGELSAGPYQSLGYCANLCPQCGDGILQTDLNEHCDDGNDYDRDGCGSNCKHEAICCIVGATPNCDWFEADGDEQGDDICEYYDQWVYPYEEVTGAYTSYSQCYSDCPRIT